MIFWEKHWQPSEDIFENYYKLFAQTDVQSPKGLRKSFL